MSKLTDKLIVAALIVVLILIAGFVTVQAASLTGSSEQARSTVLSSELSFPVRDTSSEPLVPAAGEKGEGHGCESESQVNPEE
jgi:ABC-type cobalt transport system substrate-binding protein